MADDGRNPLGERDRFGNPIERKSTDSSDRMAAVTSRMKGKVAVCVACSIGLGYSCARRLAQEGASVVIVSRKATQVEKAVQVLVDEGLDAIGFPCNVTDAAQRDALFEFVKETHGRCDSLLLNQGATAGGGSLMDTTESMWAKVMQTNLESRWLQIRAFREIMPRGSSIVITNGTGAYGPMSSAGVFYVSETALLGMTVLLAKELGEDGIRVNAVAPGPVRTRFASDLWVGENEEQSARSRWLGRIGEPDDIAGAVAFMCSDDAAWYTGQTMSVDGGAYSRL
eukprot:COSAG06_NODE_549_length_14405_cov_6.391933_3_plen_283_part_00